MKTIHTSETMDIPEGVTLEIKARMVKVTGPRGTLTRNFKHLNLDFQVRCCSSDAHSPSGSHATVIRLERGAQALAPGAGAESLRHLRLIRDEQSPGSPQCSRGEAGRADGAKGVAVWRSLVYKVLVQLFIRNPQEVLRRLTTAAREVFCGEAHETWPQTRP